MAKERKQEKAKKENEENVEGENEKRDDDHENANFL